MNRRTVRRIRYQEDWPPLIRGFYDEACIVRGVYLEAILGVWCVDFGGPVYRQSCYTGFLGADGYVYQHLKDALEAKDAPNANPF